MAGLLHISMAAGSLAHCSFLMEHFAGKAHSSRDFGRLKTLIFNLETSIHASRLARRTVPSNRPPWMITMDFGKVPSLDYFLAWRHLNYCCLCLYCSGHCTRTHCKLEAPPTPRRLDARNFIYVPSQPIIHRSISKTSRKHLPPLCSKLNMSLLLLPLSIKTNTS